MAVSLDMLALIVNLECSHPRLKFAEFFETTHGMPTTGYAGIQTTILAEEIVSSAAEYLDYAERWRDKCGAPVWKKGGD